MARVLDLFSGAAGGWSLGMHRAGFVTVAACENVEWRRILYAENNPNVRLYDDVRTLSAIQLVRDLGYLPDVIVGSPPCQDISSANTKGRGVEGERSGLFFEAVRLIGECRPRWFALENSANLRTRGADAVLAALEAIGYTCWPFVVRASDIGANHERPRSWRIGCDLAQVADPCCAIAAGRDAMGGRRRGPEGLAGIGSDGCDAREKSPADAHEDEIRQPKLSRRPEPQETVAGQSAAYPDSPSEHAPSVDAEMAELRGVAGDREPRKTPDPDQAGQADGCLEPGLRQEEITDDGCGDGRSADRSGVGQMAVCADDRQRSDGPWPLWSLDDLAGRLRLDDGLPARVAGTRVAVGGPKGTAAPSLIVEAYGDAVVPQIPEAIGRAILRVEDALAAIYPERKAA